MKVIPNGAHVITEGEFGNHMYVLDKGQVGEISGINMLHSTFYEPTLLKLDNKLPYKTM